MGAPTIAAIVAVLLFSLVGVVSAGAFVANKIAGGNTSPVKHSTTGTGNSLAATDLARAQAQATAIVRQAQNAGHSIMSSQRARAQKQAQSILAAAHRQANKLHQQATAPVATAAPVSQRLAPAPTAVPYAYPTSSGYGGQAVGQVPGAAGTQQGTGVAPAPKLGTVPASWLVVGYNASFGHGPGSAGGISVINRSGKVFSGVARVVYASGGLATAAFSGLAPGQAITLPLTGRAYAGGGYTIQLVGLH